MATEIANAADDAHRRDANTTHEVQQFFDAATIQAVAHPVIATGTAWRVGRGRTPDTPRGCLARAVARALKLTWARGPSAKPNRLENDQL
jgi:hypothetical protein